MAKVYTKDKEGVTPNRERDIYIHKNREKIIKEE